jgi:hypothetical protein
MGVTPAHAAPADSAAVAPADSAAMAAADSAAVAPPDTAAVPPPAAPSGSPEPSVPAAPSDTAAVPPPVAPAVPADTAAALPAAPADTAAALPAAPADTAAVSPPAVPAVPAPPVVSPPAPPAAPTPPAPPAKRRERRPFGGMWEKRAQWVTLKAGYAKAALDQAADGNLGFGVGYTHFLSKQWSLGLQVHYEVLQRYAGPAEVEMPITLESAYHFNWPTEAKPFLGAGGGAFLHQYLHTPADEDETRNGAYLLGGFNLPLSQRQLIGLETRMVFEFGAKSQNPVFPVEDDVVIHYSAKVTYSGGF